MGGRRIGKPCHVFGCGALLWCAATSSLLFRADGSDRCANVLLFSLLLSSVCHPSVRRVGRKQAPSRRSARRRLFKAFSSAVVETIMSAETLSRSASTSEGIRLLHLHCTWLRFDVEGCITWLPQKQLKGFQDRQATATHACHRNGIFFFSNTGWWMCSWWSLLCVCVCCLSAFLWLPFSLWPCDSWRSRDGGWKFTSATEIETHLWSVCLQPTVHMLDSSTVYHWAAFDTFHQSNCLIYRLKPSRRLFWFFWNNQHSDFF